jgi:hypothetical protein
MVSGHAYPWDVVGDPAFPGRVLDLGIDSVTLAATYHSTRAATPLHPRHQLVDAHDAALYRPVRPAAWPGRRLTPISPQWMDEPDPFAFSAVRLREAGLRVSAWIVLTHNTRLGRAYPDVAVVNCFGEPYPYALCPANPEVRDYAALLAAEAVRDVEVDAVSLEACGQLGLGHLGHHEKTDGAWTPFAQRLLSICCCGACQRSWQSSGLDVPALLEALRCAVREEAMKGGGPFTAESVRRGPLLSQLEVVLGERQAAADALRVAVLAGLPSGVPVTLHAHPDPWTTGPSPGVAGPAPAGVDALLVPCWPTAVGTAETVAAAAKTGLPVDAYVTVLAPVEPEALAGHVARLREAGASRLSLYHLGLAPRWRLRLLSELAAGFREGNGS